MMKKSVLLTVLVVSMICLFGCASDIEVVDEQYVVIGGGTSVRYSEPPVVMAETLASKTTVRESTTTSSSNKRETTTSVVTEKKTAKTTATSKTTARTECKETKTTTTVVTEEEVLTNPPFEVIDFPADDNQTMTDPTIPINTKEDDEEEIPTPDFSVVADFVDDGLVKYGYESKTSWSAPDASYQNMKIACDVLTNEVAYIPPGGSFSWLEDVGPCDSEPYVFSNAYSNGKVIQARGGGICMIASALRVAAWKSGCIVTEYHLHSLPVPYNPRDYDEWRLYEATVDASGQDLKFYNPSSTTGLTINAYVNRKDCMAVVELIPDIQPEVQTE